MRLSLDIIVTPVGRGNAHWLGQSWTLSAFFNVAWAQSSVGFCSHNLCSASRGVYVACKLCFCLRISARVTSRWSLSFCYLSIYFQVFYGVSCVESVGAQLMVGIYYHQPELSIIFFGLYVRGLLASFNIHRRHGSVDAWQLWHCYHLKCCGISAVYILVIDKLTFIPRRWTILWWSPMGSPFDLFLFYIGY